MLARMLQQIIQMSAHFSEYRCSTGAKAPDPFSATDAALKGRSSTVASGPS